jgi:hypothetical protein
MNKYRSMMGSIIYIPMDLRLNNPLDFLMNKPWRNVSETCHGFHTAWQWILYERCQGETLAKSPEIFPNVYPTNFLWNSLGFI